MYDISMELYKKYLAERDGAELYFDDTGFVTYSIATPHFCYLSEIYIVKAKRGTRAALRMYNRIVNLAKEQKCNFMVGSVDISTNNWQLSENLMIKMGFTLTNVDGNMRYFWLKL